MKNSTNEKIKGNESLKEKFIMFNMLLNDINMKSCILKHKHSIDNQEKCIRKDKRIRECLRLSHSLWRQTSDHYFYAIFQELAIYNTGLSGYTDVEHILALFKNTDSKLVDLKIYSIYNKSKKFIQKVNELILNKELLKAKKS
jgi:hypothetical protein